MEKEQKNNNVLFKDGKVYVLEGGRGLYCSWVKYKIVKQTKNQRVIKETFFQNILDKGIECEILI